MTLNQRLLHTKSMTLRFLWLFVCLLLHLHYEWCLCHCTAIIHAFGNANWNPISMMWWHAQSENNQNKIFRFSNRSHCCLLIYILHRDAIKSQSWYNVVLLLLFGFRSPAHLHRNPRQAVHKLSSSKEIFCVIKFHFYSKKCFFPFSELKCNKSHSEAEEHINWNRGSAHHKRCKRASFVGSNNKTKSQFILHSN